MIVKNQQSAMPDSYFELVKRFPLTHVRSRKHLGQAIALVDELLRKAALIAEPRNTLTP